MNVRVLAELSDIVVLATACGDMAAVSADRQHITTEYQMRIERAFSGEPQLKPGDMLDVSLPGGRVVFSDGSSVEGWTRDLALMEPGRKYLLFLKAVDSPAPEAVAARIGARGRYVPTMGSQGMFDITGTSANGVVPMGRQDTPVAYELSTLGASEAAIRRVQNAADSLHRERLAKEPR